MPEHIEFPKPPKPSKLLSLDLASPKLKNYATTDFGRNYDENDIEELKARIKALEDIILKDERLNSWLIHIPTAQEMKIYGQKTEN